MFHNVYRPKVSDPGPSWPSCYRVKQRQLHKFKYNFGNHQANFIWKIPPTHQIKIACRSSPPIYFILEQPLVNIYVYLNWNFSV